MDISLIVLQQHCTVLLGVRSGVVGGGRLSDRTGVGSGFRCMCDFANAVRRGSAMKWDSVSYDCMLTVCTWHIGDVCHHDVCCQAVLVGRDAFSWQGLS
jgi:hypothetical protein